MLICAFDDRPTDIIGLKLLVCSLTRYLPDAPVRIFCPVADAEFRSWLRSYAQVTLDDDARLRGTGWDAKPGLLLQLLDEGHESVIWLDSDVIVNRDFRPLLPAGDAVVVAEEPALNAYSVRQRICGWGLTPGQRLPGVNSCCIRVRQAHRGLLERWRAMLQTPAYRQATTLPFELRAPHLLGDQDVLLALLASRDYGDLPVHVLRAGREVLQHFGAHAYTPMQRLRHLWSGLPHLIHCQGYKPWRFLDVPSWQSAPRDYLRSLCLETAPYAHLARDYRAQIRPFPEYLEIRTVPGKLSEAVSFGRPALRGFTQATCALAWVRTRRLVAYAGRGFRKLAAKAAFGARASSSKGLG